MNESKNDIKTRVGVKEDVDGLAWGTIAGVPDCNGVTLASPHLVGGKGARAVISLPLNSIEAEALRRSAGILREAMESLKVSCK